ncbi:MAG: aldo/keto reductase [Akkermansia sp.]|nr:aldo/keto reductase [Akkermansia sp.]
MSMEYRRCGKSGVLLPEVSLGLWHNFGDGDDPAEGRALIARALELGVCHFDLANNYGPPPGAAEERFGNLQQREFAAHRDEMFISTKAGYLMWGGPYGDWGSRKYLVASLNQSLRRMKLDYVDVFYHHRPDPETPLEETMQALIDIVRSGKALYAGLSNYPPELYAQACAMLREAHVPCLLHQFRLNLIDREPGTSRLAEAVRQGTGSIAFSPLAQGVLTGKYLNRALPADSRAVRDNSVFLNPERARQNDARVQRIVDTAARAGMPPAQLALRWLLSRPGLTSVLIGARRVPQLEECAAASGQPPLPEDVLQALDRDPA